MQSCKNRAENARIAIRNIRRDAIADYRELMKEKLIAEDDGEGEERVKELPILEFPVDQLLATKNRFDANLISHQRLLVSN